MIKPMHAITATVLFILPIFSFANDICFKNLINEDMCAHANKIASEAGKSLPIKLNDNMSIVSINAILNKLLVVAHLNHNNSYLSKVYNGDVTLENKLKSVMRNYSKSSICSNRQMKAFIHLGGEIEYRYVFSDGNIFDTYAITNCE
ncbi:TPA: hypothetical protein RVQ02_004336 [Escherichia coli]|nr:hypothetical protein [Escherichia coli]HEA3004149.1 hypothetical protein [Escherichia coli]